MDLDPSLREYHEKIAERIEAARATPYGASPRALLRPQLAPLLRRRPDLLRGHVLAAHNRTSKFDRTIAFTDIDMTDKYAAYLDLSSETRSRCSARPCRS